MRGVWPERKRISLSAQAQCGERQDFRVVAAADGESTELGLWSLLPVSAQREGLYLEPQARVPDLQRIGAGSSDQAEEEYEPSEARAADGAEVDQRSMVDGLHAQSVY